MRALPCRQVTRTWPWVLRTSRRTALIGNHAARAREQRQAQTGLGLDRGLALHQLEAFALRVRTAAQAALRIQFDLQLRRGRDLQSLTGAGMEIGCHGCHRGPQAHRRADGATTTRLAGAAIAAPRKARRLQRWAGVGATG